ncbi:hypothetical protein GALL_545380 [mine drainage metagenome]|uniref:Uncharacterized protein n=1 Tax=mine drainage metagenome TaxID=410659 RepID=A0A1J5NYR9_9ZZZZ
MADAGHRSIGADPVQLAVVAGRDEAVAGGIGREIQYRTVVGGSGRPLTGTADRRQPHGSVAQSESGMPSIAGKPHGNDKRIQLAGYPPRRYQKLRSGRLAHDRSFSLFIMTWPLPPRASPVGAKMAGTVPGHDGSR